MAAEMEMAQRRSPGPLVAARPELAEACWKEHWTLGESLLECWEECRILLVWMDCSSPPRHLGWVEREWPQEWCHL